MVHTVPIINITVSDIFSFHTFIIPNDIAAVIADMTNMLKA